MLAFTALHFFPEDRQHDRCAMHTFQKLPLRNKGKMSQPGFQAIKDVGGI